jgi:hypothetical protein
MGDGSKIGKVILTHFDVKTILTTPKKCQPNCKPSRWISTKFKKIRAIGELSKKSYAICAICG